MGLIDSIRSYFGFDEERGQTVYIPRLPMDPDTWLPWVSFNGNQYAITGLNQTLAADREEIDTYTFAGLVQNAYQSNGVVFACMLTRLMLFTQARFQYQTLRKGRPDELFGNASLDILERPWTNATTADLLARAITDADAAGNFYVTRRRNQLRRLRPDWVSIVYGSEHDADVMLGDIEADVLGYIYYPGGKYSGREPEILLAPEVVHWAPIPDPLAWGRGMSWLTPIMREIMGDSAATSHKLKFFENGATVNLIVQTGVADLEKFKEWKRLFTEGHEGAARAYKTLFLTPGADVKAVGADFQQMDFKATQGAGETRIAAAARVHPAIVGLSEGLQGASLNAGNFAAARRLVADGFLYPSWGSFAGAMETLVPPPAGSRLWVDTRDVPFLREDRKDAAEIEQIKASTIRNLVDAGFEPESVVKAVEAEDMGLLKHSQLYSVQLQPPMPDGPPKEPTTKPEVPLIPATTQNGNGRQHDLEAETRMYQALEMLKPAPLTFPEGMVRVEAPVTVNNPEQPAAVVNVTLPEQAPPVVNIEAPSPAEVNVTVEAPPPAEFTVEAPPPAAVNVTVEAPPAAEVNVTVEPPPPVEVTVNVPEPKPVTRTRRVKREKGLITEIIEE